MQLFYLLVLIVPILVIAAAIANSTLKPAPEGRPKGFPWILLLFGIVVVAGIATLLMMGFAQQHLVIEVRGPPGVDFIGEAVVDGVIHPLNGTAPQRFELTGTSFEAIVLAAEPDPDNPLVVFTGGSYEGLGSVDPYGIRIVAYKRFMSSGSGWNFVSPTEWETWVERLRPAESPEDALPDPATSSNEEQSEETVEPHPEGLDAPQSSEAHGTQSEP